MTGLTGLYTFVTVTISLIFLSLYYFSGSVFCLIPVGLVLFDYIKTVRIARRQREVDNRTIIDTIRETRWEIARRQREVDNRTIIDTIRETRWELERAMHRTSSDSQTTGPKPFEFILEEEFKV